MCHFEKRQAENFHQFSYRLKSLLVKGYIQVAIDADTVQAVLDGQAADLHSVCFILEWAESLDWHG